MPSTNVEFVDSNVLVYAYDLSSATKRQVAKDLLERLWSERRGAVSVQVLQEFYVTVTRKLAEPLPSDTARKVIAGFRRWRVAAPDVRAVLKAVDTSRRYEISFWDAMILTTAGQVGATVVWSEDLSSGQQYGPVTVRNPFAP